jgi:hypothetical protein
MTRLGTISINISIRFEQASEVVQRKVVSIACRRAVSDVNLTGHEIQLALQLIESGACDAGLRDKLKAIADEFDEVYFDMSDGAGEAQLPSDSKALANAADVNFRKSRAAQALAYGVSGDRNDLSEALYEAVHALADEADVMPIIERELAATKPTSGCAE